MTRLLVSVVAVFTWVSVVTGGCTQAAPAPAPTQPPAAPTKAAEPTKAAAPAKAAEPTKAAAAPQPTAPPAPKVDFPAKGRGITFVVGMAAGGGADASARIVAAAMEGQLGSQVQVLNKPGASTQAALTELLASKPDGYTIAQASFPTNIVTYLDPTRKAPYTRKDFQTVAGYSDNAMALAVKTDSPYRALKDLLDASRAKPESIKMGDAGLLTIGHMVPLRLELEARVKFASVHFEGSGPAMAALLGGHIDAAVGSLPSFAPQTKAGQVRVLGMSDRERDRSFPDVLTMMEQGYNVYLVNHYGILGPGGIPREILDILSAAVKRSLETAEVKAKMENLALTPHYMDPAQLASFWANMENDVKPLMELAR